MQLIYGVPPVRRLANFSNDSKSFVLCDILNSIVNRQSYTALVGIVKENVRK